MPATHVSHRTASRIALVGIDEAGRGALAGPVVAAACTLPDITTFPVRIADSKQMTPSERQESYAWLIANCTYGVGTISAEQVDAIGILGATECAMQQAVRAVADVHPKLYLIVDGRDAFWFDHPHSSVVRGDETEPAIAAASIIAKVTRDAAMTEAGTAFPLYGFETHKGYGTSEHIRLLETKGPCALHRRTFLKNILKTT